ncbi:hypothetical protein GGR22_000568 [Flavobacterium gossypii]|uniref:DUF3592 domain-containing protein n=1 Tax=Flavobacterium gossypii TaxID=1646119 RepID=A0ABR6DL81_9FLAO|nr:DUF3592 domain-containing protein [Flavobacterium gossypii]MBA9072442.1 hypothetical protein [Flavobacterium gossypii]
MKFIEKYWVVFIIVFAFFAFYKPALVFLQLGSLVLFMGIHYFLFLKHIGKNGIRSVGKILSYEAGNKGGKIPVIGFETLEGQYIKKQPYYYASSDIDLITSFKKNIDRPVAVLYDPLHPENFILAKEKDSNYGSLVLMVFVGTIFIIVSVSSLLGYIKIDF